MVVLHNVYRTSTSGCHFIRIDNFSEVPLLILEVEFEDKEGKEEEEEVPSSTRSLSTTNPSLALHSRTLGTSILKLYSLTRSQHIGDGGGLPTQGKA